MDEVQVRESAGERTQHRDLTGNKRSTCFHTTEEKLRERTETRSRGVNRKRQLTLETTGESDRTLYAVKVFQIVLHYS